ARPLDGSCRSRRRRRGGTIPAAIERRRLLDRTPILLVGRNNAGEHILVRIIPALLFGAARLDPDLGNKTHALEPLGADVASRTRLRALIVRLEAERAIENGLEHADIAGGHLLLAVGGAGGEQVGPEFPPFVRSVENGEFEIEHLALTTRTTLVHPILADAAGADVGGNGRNRSVRD